MVNNAIDIIVVGGVKKSLEHPFCFDHLKSQFCKNKKQNKKTKEKKLGLSSNPQLADRESIANTNV